MAYSFGQHLKYSFLMNLNHTKILQAETKKHVVAAG